MSTAIDVPFIRKHLKWTRADLAAEAGVDVSTVCRWETKGVPERGAARSLLDSLQKRAAKKAARTAATSEVAL